MRLTIGQGFESNGLGRYLQQISVAEGPSAIERVLRQGNRKFSRFYIFLGVYQHMRNVRVGVLKSRFLEAGRAEGNSD